MSGILFVLAIVILMDNCGENRSAADQPPPGTVIVRCGIVEKGDWFYNDYVCAWELVPEIGWGDAITNIRIARDMKKFRLTQK